MERTISCGSKNSLKSAPELISNLKNWILAILQSNLHYMKRCFAIFCHLAKHNEMPYEHSPVSEVVAVQRGPGQADALGRLIVLEQPLDRGRRNPGDVGLQTGSWSIKVFV